MTNDLTTRFNHILEEMHRPQTIGNSKKYVGVCTREPWNKHYFESLDKAQKQAEIHFELTGHFVKIEEVKELEA